MKRLVVASLLTLATLLVAGSIALGQGVPEFKLGFKALADQIPDVAGQPVEDEHYGANGDSLQQTTQGLMAWRKADNWTAFTNGTTTWVNGPYGVMERSNEARFAWEMDLPTSTPAPNPLPPTATPVPTAPMPTATPAPLKTGIQPGALAPDFALASVDGGTVRLSDYRGRPVVVSFWATWCPYCRDEMVVKAAALEKYREQGLVLLSVDKMESASTVQSFLEGKNYNWTFLLDTDGRVTTLYQSISLPNSIFIDSNGIIRNVVRGEVTPDSFDTYVKPILQGP